MWYRYNMIIFFYGILKMDIQQFTQLELEMNGYLVSTVATDALARPSVSMVLNTYSLYQTKNIEDITFYC